MLLQCAVWEEHQLLSIIKRATHNWITSTTVQSYQFKNAHKHVQYYQCMAQSNQWEGRANYTTMRKSAVALVYQHIYANTNMIKASKSERNMRVELNQLEPSLVRVCSFERHLYASWCGLAWVVLVQVAPRDWNRLDSCLFYHFGQFCLLGRVWKMSRKRCPYIFWLTM